MSRENLQVLIERLSEDLGLSDLRLDSDLDACGFQIDGKLDALIEYDLDSETAMFTITIGALPKSGRAEFLQDLLDANFYGAGTGGATLSTNSDAGLVYLQLREPTDQLDQARLTELLQALVATAMVWHGRLESGAIRSSASPSGDEPFRVPRGLSMHGLV